jgi:hypothetical protein
MTDRLSDWPPISAQKVSVAPIDVAHRATAAAAAALGDPAHFIPDISAMRTALTDLVAATAALVEWAHDANRAFAVMPPVAVTATGRPETDGAPARTDFIE